MTITANAKSVGEAIAALSPWSPRTPLHRVTDVTPELLTRLLSGTGGARVEAVELGKGTSGTTDRQQVTVQWNDAGRRDGPPASLFVKSTPSMVTNRLMSAVTGLSRVETTFYKSCRPGLHNVPAPRCHFAEYGSGARHLIILDDITIDGVRPCELTEDCTLSFAENLMDTFAALHGQFWETARFGSDLSWVAPLSERVGFRALAWQFRRMRTSLTERPELSLPDEVHRMCEFVNAHDRELYRRWERGPRTLIHGDTHLGNTFEPADGRAGLLDWQLVHRAPGLREVAYTLIWSLPVELRRQHESHLISRYLDGLAANGVTDPPTYEQAWDDYRFFAFDAWDSIAFGVAWPGMQSVETVEAGFHRANAAVADLEVSEALASYLN
ncbi:phosphotransferase family protein [Nocardia jinanensis]|nr:phosphotransferase [Nocardia jinanensis]